MPATAITVTKPNRTGVTTPATAACDNTNGNSVSNSAGLILMFENSDASNPHDVIFTTPVEQSGLAVADYSVTLAASAKKSFAGFSGDTFGRTIVFTASSNLVKVAAVATS